MTNDQNTNIISNSRFTEIRASDVSHNRSRCPLTCPWCYLNILYVYILYIYHICPCCYLNSHIYIGNSGISILCTFSRSLFSQPTQSIFSHKVHHCLHISSPYSGWAISLPNRRWVSFAHSHCFFALTMASKRVSQWKRDWVTSVG